MAEKTCPTCGDQNVHANIPSEIIACATRKALVDALHAYAEEIDERSHRWCAPDLPCHADVLLELANAGEPS